MQDKEAALDPLPTHQLSAYRYQLFQGFVHQTLQKVTTSRMTLDCAYFVKSPCELSAFPVLLHVILNPSPCISKWDPNTEETNRKTTTNVFLHFPLLEALLPQRNSRMVYVSCACKHLGKRV